ncbi:MAG: hypothetical protein HY901_14470 [Deltaproteobacteria bacterium]|nr:hypothetical protein [Deltaproteobacteria bacterium]
MKIWRAGTNWEGYTGSLYYPFTGSYSEIYMRYYVRLPRELDLSQCSGSNYLKLWRLNITGTAHEIYLNINQNGGSLYNTGSLQVLVGTWATVLSHATLAAIWDNNWHSWEWHINLSTGLLELWIDGVRMFSESGVGFGGGTFSFMQHFSMGNHATGCTWQPSWQAMEIDDFVLSTTYVGTGDAAPDTQPPARLSGLPSGTLAAGTSSTAVSLSTGENATCRYATRAGVSFGSMSGSFSTTGVMNHTFTATGLVNGGSYSFYVRCQDAAGNSNPDDFLISFNVAAAGVRPSPPRNVRAQ